MKQFGPASSSANISHGELRFDSQRNTIGKKQAKFPCPESQSTVRATRGMQLPLYRSAPPFPAGAVS